MTGLTLITLNFGVTLFKFPEITIAACKSCGGYNTYKNVEVSLMCLEEYYDHNCGSRVVAVPVLFDC